MLTSRSRVLTLGLLLAFGMSVRDRVQGQDRAAAKAPVVDFNRDIRPILSDNCLKCHGPDEKERKAKLRLDVREEALGHGEAIVPGKSSESELIRRISAEDANERMPPRKTGKRLTPRQIELLRHWIDQGARYAEHWAFVPPQRPALPELSKGWAGNPIDRFILSRLKREGLQPSPEADKATLIRRLTLDLTGLPPTLAEVDAFVGDASPDAYAKLVERLLASPRYGERMALEWLDAARFADTHGYHIDSGRDMTRWRDWVIQAFNRNLPFDQFTIEQIAGDLLPDASIEQKIASGFNRNHMINFEGGAIPEEYQTAYIVDRVNTTGTVWLGLTVGCAQCHDHKYDPISQKEYYQLYAFFNNVPENGLDGRVGNAVPVLKLPGPDQQKKLDDLAKAIKEAEHKLNGPHVELDEAQIEWEKLTQVGQGDNKVEWTVLELKDFKAASSATLKRLPDDSILANGDNPPTETYTIEGTAKVKDITAVRVEALTDESLPANGPGRPPNGNIVLTAVKVSTGGKALKLKAASADFSQEGFPVAHAIDSDPKTGWAIHPQTGKSHFAVFELEQPVNLEGDAHLRVVLDFQSQFAQHQLGRFRISVTSAKGPHGTAQLPAKVRALVAVPADQRNDAQRAELRAYFRSSVSAQGKKLASDLARLRKEQTELDKQVPTAMVMQDLPKPRDTFMLVRGQYDKKGERVSAGVPKFLQLITAPRADAPGSATRLELAKWLVDPANPLTARVIVNRYWQMYFGTGLVKTSEDFGSQGEWPSHPELLDWLAVEFVESKWDVKHMQRLIVTSATYRQSSRMTPEVLAKDPENRLLARQTRLRLPAEFIRDQALMVSGLLNGEIGGKSVSPYQPPGIWEELAYREDFRNFSAQVYEQSKGKDLYRRTMYTFWKRTAPPPSLITLDAPDRETCTVRRPRTNTPLQALVLMNDPTYVEASRQLAERLLGEAGLSTQERITRAFRLMTARRPRAEEMAVLQRVLDQQLARFRTDGAAALKLLRVGESPRDEKLDAAELAAWAMLVSAILNLDEAVTRN